MESSTRGFDPTLPLDFDGSTNMMDLPDITLGNGYYGHESHSGTSQVSDVSSTPSPFLKPMVSKTNSGRMSPVRGRTMKEYDQQITELKKENFSLKLRIYFLEERMQQKYGDGEDVFKTNIELKVAVQSLKKELEDKQDLLRKASQAMETLTSSQQCDMEVIRESMEEEHHRHTEELRSDLQKALQDAENCRQESDAAREKMMDLEVRIQQLEAEHQQECIATQKLKDALNSKERELMELHEEADTTARALEQVQRLMREVETQREASEQRAQQFEKDLERRGRDVEDVVDDQQEALKRLDGKVRELQEALATKEDMVGRLEDGLRDKDKAWKEAANKAEQLESELEQEREYGSRRDKTIQGLVTSLHKKEKEVKSMKDKQAKSQELLQSLREDLHKAEMEKHKEVEKLQEQLVESEDSNRRLQTQLSVANADVENMIKSLGKKEGELAGFREQLEKANQALQRSEEALEALQNQLEKERDQAHGKLDSQAQQFQHALEDYLRQLEGKDGLMAQMTAQLRAKDQQLTSLMDLLTEDTNKGQKAVLQRLEDGLNRSADSVQSALEEKQQELKQKSRELHEARQALQDKSRELEQAAMQLLERQQDLERLQMRNKEQGDVTSQLSAALARAQYTLEEALERHADALHEKDNIVQRLQNSLAEKEHMIEELTNKTPAVDKEHQRLRAQLRDKDQLIQELQTDQVRASCEKDQLARTMQARVHEKEAEIEMLSKKQQKEVVNRDQEIQQLMAQLNKRDMQLQGLESRMAQAEELQHEALDRLRRMMAEKDRTIEALVDSVGEKERLLRRSQQNLTEDAKAQLAEMDTLMAENARLKRQLQERGGVVCGDSSRPTDKNNRETLHSSYHETITHNVVDNAPVVRLLEEQVRETHALCDLLRQERQGISISVDRHSDYATTSRDSGLRDNQCSLSAVEKLCQRLEAGVDRSQQLHRSLLGHTGRNTDHLTSSESSVEGVHFDLRPSIHRYGDDRDLFPSASTSCTSTASNLNTPSDFDRNAGVSGAAQRSLPRTTSSFAVQTSPSLQQLLSGPILVAQGSGPILVAQTVTDGAERPGGGVQTTGSQTSVISLEGSKDSLVECAYMSSGEGSEIYQALSQGSLTSVGSLSSAQLAGMSAAVLRDLVSQLQEDLVAASQRNTALTHQLQSLNRDHQVDGEGDHDGDERVTQAAAMAEKDMSMAGVGQLQAEVKSLKQALRQKEEETSSLRQNLGLAQSLSGSGVDGAQPQSSAELHKQVQELRQQVRDMSRANNVLRQQIRLNSQTEDAPQGFNPQLIVEMAAEIERLKLENTRFRSVEMRAEFSEQRSEHSAHIPSECLSPEVVVNDGDSVGLVIGHEDRSPVNGHASPLARRSQCSGSNMRLSASHTDHCLPSSSPTSPIQSGSPSRNDRADSYGHADSSLSRGPHKTSSLSSVESDWAPRVVGGGESRSASPVPRLAKLKLNGTDSASSQPMVNMTRKLQDAQEQVKSLEERLQATEGTVRYMSQRLRHYRAVVGGRKEQGLSRSHSDACLNSHQTMSLSFSCGDLHEASQAATHAVGHPMVLGIDSSGFMPGNGHGREDSEFSTHIMIRDLKEQIRILKEKHSQELEMRDGQLACLRQITRQPPPGQEEDVGSSHMMHNGETSWASVVSRETMRHDTWSSGQSFGPQGSNDGWSGQQSVGPQGPNDRPLAHPSQGGCRFQDSSLNASRQVSDPSRSTAPGWSNHTDTTPHPSTHHNGDMSALALHGDMTFSTMVGEDVPDSTQIDNLTYTSFSESILPVGLNQGHNDSAWSSPHLQQVRGNNIVQARRINTEPHGLSPLTRSEGVGGREQFSTGVGDDGSPKDAAENTAIKHSQRLDSAGDELTSFHPENDQSISALEASRLQAKVMVLSDMNHTMREELRIYDSMCRSLGVQVTSGTATGARSGESSGEDSCDGEIRLLQLHLKELRRLRSRLEQLDTDAHNAVQLSSLLNEQHIRRISQLEALLSQVTQQLALQEALAAEHQATIIERERIIRETTTIVERKEKEAQQLQEKMVELQESDSERAKQQEGEIEELRQELQDLQDQLTESQEQEQVADKKLTGAQKQVQDSQKQIQNLSSDLKQAKQRTKSLESDLAHAKQLTHSLELKMSQSSQGRKDLEFRLSEAERQRDALQSKLALNEEKMESLELALVGDKQQASTLRTELADARNRLRSLESELGESRKQISSLESELAKLRKQTAAAQTELDRSEQLCQLLESEKKELKQCVDRLELELSESRRECQTAQRRAAEVTAREEECAQLMQRVKHFQERMSHYEQCMWEYQQQATNSQTKVRELQDSLRATQTSEEDTKSELRIRESRIQKLELELEEAVDHANTNESIAHRADSLARTLEGRVRDLEGKIKDAEGKVQEAHGKVQEAHGKVQEAHGKVQEAEGRRQEAEVKVKQGQATLAEHSTSMETLRKEMSERNAKLKKRDAQLKKLVEEYKKVTSAQKEMSQLNQTLKCELKLYETMHSQTELSRDKKEELMRQLLSELSQTRRLAEDLIARLEHTRQNDSPPSTSGGPEAADGRPSPEPRDGVQHTSLTSTGLRIHTECYGAALDSLASSRQSVRSDADGFNPRSARHSESPVAPSLSPVSVSSQSDGGNRLRRSDFGSAPASSFPGPSPGAMSSYSMDRFQKEMASSFNADRLQGESSLSDLQKGQISTWERGAVRPYSPGSEDWGRSHMRSYTYPVSLKYWQDRNASLTLSTVMPRVEVDSDLRRLFAISGLEAYEKLKRENGELISTVCSMQARMTDRLKTFANVPISEIIKSVEYSTLRELQMAAQNLRICAEEESRLLAAFWLTQLPPMNAQGEFYDPRTTDENESLKIELRKQKSRYDMLAHTVREQQERLHATNALRKKWETTLYKQLSHTTQVLDHAKENFDTAGLAPPKQKSLHKSHPPRRVKDKN